MLLRSVTLKRFRAFEDVVVDLDESTVLIGENNSGKTSFLDAIRLCLGRPLSRRSSAFDESDAHHSKDGGQTKIAEDFEIIFAFGESTRGEWIPALVQKLADVVVLRGELREIRLRVICALDPDIKEYLTDWEFLNPEGEALPPKTKQPGVLQMLHKLRPAFHLGAVRDAAKEFGPRAPFWSSGLRD